MLAWCNAQPSYSDPSIQEIQLRKLDIASCAGFMVFAMSSIVTPVCLPEISRTLSTGFSEGGGLESARTFVVLTILLLAGLLAQRWGKKPFLTLGQYLMAAGLLMMSFAQSYLTLIGSLMIIGIGGGFAEALLNPLVADVHPENPGRHLNITNAFYPIGVMVSALVFGELLTLGYSWRIICRIAAVATLLVGVLFSSSRFPSPTGEGESGFRSLGRTLGRGSFWLFAAAIFLGAGVESAFTFWSRSYVEAYLQDVPRAGAVAVVIFAGLMALGRLFAAKFSKTVSLKSIMLWSAVLGAIISAIIPFAASLTWFYVLLALAGIAAACFWPTILAEAADVLKVDPTMLFVLLACFGIAGFGVTPWAMGVIGDKVNLRAAFYVVPAMFVALATILGIEWRVKSTDPKKA